MAQIAIPKGLYLLMLLGSAVLVGVLAQKWKGRTGALWGFLTLLAQAATWVILMWALTVQDPRFIERDPNGLLTLQLFGLAAAVVMAGIVATLPARKAG